MQIVVFEDEQVSNLAPITLGRPAFAIGCGSRSLSDLLAELGCPVHAVVRPHLRALVAALASLAGDASATGANSA
jgi:UDP-N-acetylglucosamine diphosphorylase / glucose-1-phosphate thymidylyltransferase / UDP-N-acetylgalactosamine diphosphorylase / glucosamine-1-phosphate N-acetyltransferase / galactosamine-1-phosphate N-acetyltransferase